MQRPSAASDDASRIKAPDLMSADGWLNTEQPLSINDLRGQVVLLDFWTYCCINCLHVLPDLKYLEQKYADKPLVVIGVHSGKFDQEKDAENIRQAVLRHNIEHPVAVDSDFEIWNAYAVRAWPTFVLIAPPGPGGGAGSGEGHRDTLDRAIARLLDKHASEGTLGKPMDFRLQREGFKPGELAFPGKLLADEQSQRLFISDTNHHRVLMADMEGTIKLVIGSGDVGLKDGSFDEARFHQPQGLALSDDGRCLYIADTENHAVRLADLEKRTVTTIAGTGRQTYDFQAAGPAASTALSSPWDLVRIDQMLYIAMAGTHQIWVMNLEKGHVRVFAGTGREFCIDGPNADAGFAQPSGLATDGRLIYVADSEISSIRVVEAGTGGRTRTLAGSGDLFGFGHKDGTRRSARFQHPLGVALQGDRLFVADTFNHLIRVIDVETGRVNTWLGAGTPDPGTPDAVGLFEPGGLSIAGQTLYIADTNHHRIIAVDIPSKKAGVLIPCEVE